VARVYATRADLIAYPPPPNITVPEEPEATRLLTRASERVDDALLTAVYAVDSAGMPTDASVIEALKNATCAEVIDMIRNGSDDGDDEMSRWDSVSIGSVKLSGRRAAAPTGFGAELSDEAAGHLRRAGLRRVVFHRGC
jgi:hypothetical protein